MKNVSFQRSRWNQSTLYTRTQEEILYVLPVGSRSNNPPWKHKTTEIEAKVNLLLDVSARPRCCFILASRGHFQNPHRGYPPSRMASQPLLDFLAAIRIELLWSSVCSWRPFGGGRMAQSLRSSVTSQNGVGLEESLHQLRIPRPKHNPWRISCKHDISDCPEAQASFSLNWHLLPTEGYQM